MLEVCNEALECSQSAVQPVQTYGPLVAANIQRITPTVEAQRITWTIQVDSNGDAASVSVTSDKGRSETFAIPVGVSTIVTQPRDFGFQETETVTVTLSDAAPTRGPVSVTNAATTEPPPPPSVVASRGAACNDDPAAGLQPCDTGLIGGPKCTDASCAFVHIALSGWRTDVPGTAVYCQVNNGGGLPYDPGASVDTPSYFGSPGGTVDVLCENALGQQASAQLVW
jgi:large repetitive protein